MLTNKISRAVFFIIFIFSLIVSADFQLVQLGTFRRDQYLLNTKTGELRKQVCIYAKQSTPDSDCDYTAWVKVDVEGVGGLSYEKIIKKGLNLNAQEVLESKKSEEQSE